jgi:hypothetical protein
MNIAWMMSGKRQPQDDNRKVVASFLVRISILKIFAIDVKISAV